MSFYEGINVDFFLCVLCDESLRPRPIENPSGLRQGRCGRLADDARYRATASDTAAAQAATLLTMSARFDGMHMMTIIPKIGAKT